MDIQSFKNWVKDQYGFDCDANDLFSKALDAEYNMIINTTFDGVPALQYHGDSFRKELLQHYTRTLQSLIDLIPSCSGSRTVNMYGVHLNQFLEHQDELKYLLNRLKSQC